uniref:Putative nicotinate-nucleotide adenylyltransferase n=1 Tax=Anthurium amnicola TaxID=1678845 RepID=A0A1D1YRL0_9ARAE
MARCCRCCSGFSRAALVAFLLISAVPLALLVALERGKSAGEYFEFRSLGWVRECAKWDDVGRRFLVSTFYEGGVSEVAVPERGGAGALLEERLVLQDADMAGNGSVGILLDRVRGRLLVTYADVRGNRFGALGAYDLSSWRRIFLTQLSGPGDEPSLADDVAVDGDGNAYVTDAMANKIWKLGPNGNLLSTIRSPAFTQKKSWFASIVGLNGIVVHPNGYLLVVHTFGGLLFKVDIATAEVSVVQVAGASLLFGDGLELLSPTKLVVAGMMPSGRVLESSDDWRSATLTGKYVGPVHRISASVTVKDGKVYLGHLLGGGLLRRTHVITEAVFSPVNSNK